MNKEDYCYSSASTIPNTGFLLRSFSSGTPAGLNYNWYKKIERSQNHPARNVFLQQRQQQQQGQFRPQRFRRLQQDFGYGQRPHQRHRQRQQNQFRDPNFEQHAIDEQLQPVPGEYSLILLNLFELIKYYVFFSFIKLDSLIAIYEILQLSKRTRLFKIR